ncbi:hypothetical protein BSK43_005400 [Rhizobium sp. P44RR-XXIV]|nr:hypothetical protein BSK43_005400 [Rhizobium sp. P44RR-XXIV]
MLPACRRPAHHSGRTLKGSPPRLRPRENGWQVSAALESLSSRDGQRSRRRHKAFVSTDSQQDGFFEAALQQIRPAAIN